MKKGSLIHLAGWIIVAVCLLIPSQGAGQEKDYPNQPITLIVPWGAGGARIRRPGRGPICPHVFGATAGGGQ
jgi:hypothetical protein